MEFRDHELLVTLARQQRIATLCAGIKAALPAMYFADVVRQAYLIDDEIQDHDRKKYLSSV